MPAEGIRIVQMQQFVMVQDDYPSGDIETSFAEIQAMDKAQMEMARAELSLLYAGGYEIASVTVGGNERVLLTVWTLKPAPATVSGMEMFNLMTDALRGGTPNTLRKSEDSSDAD